MTGRKRRRLVGLVGLRWGLHVGTGEKNVGTGRELVGRKGVIDQEPKGLDAMGLADFATLEWFFWGGQPHRVPLGRVRRD